MGLCSPLRTLSAIWTAAVWNKEFSSNIIYVRHFRLCASAWFTTGIGYQSTRHTANSSQPKIIWRVDRRLKHRVVTSWPAPQKPCCHCCDKLTAHSCRRRLNCFVQSSLYLRHYEQLAIVNFLIRLCNDWLLSTILYPCRSSLCGNYWARATLVPWTREDGLSSGHRFTRSHSVLLTARAEHCVCLVVHFVFCSISCAFFE